MKKLLHRAQFILFGAFCLTLLVSVMQFFGSTNPLARLDYNKPVYNGVEEYDPSLARLNSLHKLEQYCDSLYTITGATNSSREFEQNYTDLVSSVVRKRFYHGYSYYGFKNNYLAMLFSKISRSGYSAVVIPDDILNYSFAACSQQSIVMMEILKSKGLKTRKISFQGKKDGGHFCFEVFYNDQWHFYDPNMEPDTAVLNSHGRPDIAFLVSHPETLTQAYRKYPREEIMDIFPSYSYGSVNSFPAPRAIVFQKLTKFLSYIIWAFFFIAFLLVRRKYKRLSTINYVRNNRIYFPQPQAGTSSSYYPGFTAPGT